MAAKSIDQAGKMADRIHSSADDIVTVNGECADDKVQYSIIDNGMGIHEQEHGKVFELFERSSEVKAISGTGVGLAIVKRIMKRHEGSIRLESEPGKGSVFYLVFPQHDPLDNG